MLPTKEETLKTTQNSYKYEDLKLDFWLLIQLSIIIIYKMIKQRNKPVLA